MVVAPHSGQRVPVNARHGQPIPMSVNNLTALSASPAAPNQAAERRARAAEKGTGRMLEATRYYQPPAQRAQ